MEILLLFRLFQALVMLEMLFCQSMENQGMSELLDFNGFKIKLQSQNVKENKFLKKVVLPTLSRSRSLLTLSPGHLIQFQ